MVCPYSAYSKVTSKKSELQTYRMTDRMTCKLALAHVHRGINTRYMHAVKQGLPLRIYGKVRVRWNVAVFSGYIINYVIEASLSEPHINHLTTAYLLGIVLMYHLPFVYRTMIDLHAHALCSNVYLCDTCALSFMFMYYHRTMAS